MIHKYVFQEPLLDVSRFEKYVKFTEEGGVRLFLQARTRILCRPRREEGETSVGPRYMFSIYK